MITQLDIFTVFKNLTRTRLFQFKSLQDDSTAKSIKWFKTIYGTELEWYGGKILMYAIPSIFAILSVGFLLIE